MVALATESSDTIDNAKVSLVNLWTPSTMSRFRQQTARGGHIYHSPPYPSSLWRRLAAGIFGHHRQCQGFAGKHFKVVIPTTLHLVLRYRGGV